MVAGMKLQLHFPIVALAVVLSACSGQTENQPSATPQSSAPQTAAAPAATTEKPAQPDATAAATPTPSAAEQPAPTPADAANAALVQKAEALTQEQIKQSRDPGALSKLAQLYYAQHDAERFTWALEQLVQLMPNSGNLKLQLAMAYAGADDKSKTYDMLVRLINLGYSYDVAKDPRFEKVRGTRVWDYIVDSYQNNGKQFGEGKIAFELPKGDRLLESIVWDPKRKQFLAGSVREGKIYLVDASGKLSDFISADANNGMWAVYDMAVDAAHDKLYVISNGVPHFNGFNADILGKAGVFEFTLSTGKFLHKYILPQDNGKHILSSIAVDGKGRVYAADGVSQQIYRLDGGELKLMIGNRVLTGIRGMTVSADGKTLYFADLALGIFGLDLNTLKPFDLGHDPAKLVLGGIEGLYWYDGTLVAIQNEMSPQRVMRLKLSDDGHSIVSAMPLDVAQPAFAALTIGTVANDSLYFISNSQKADYDSLGALIHADKLEPVKIFRSNLRFAWDQKGVSAAPAKPTQKFTPRELHDMLNTPPKGVVPAVQENDPNQKPGEAQQQQ